MVKTDIIKRNFLLLLRMGAFGEKGDIEPMSPYKWRILTEMARTHGVENVVSKARGCGYTAPVLPFRDAGLSHFASLPLNSRLNNIRNSEPVAVDASIETLKLLDIIVAASTNAISDGLSFDDILRIGLFLREEGDKVDFIKLETWLRKLKLTRMAQLEGSILVTAFGFEQDEIPFVYRIEPNAMSMVMAGMEELQKNLGQRPPASRGRVAANYFRFFFFAPIETIGNVFRRFVRSLARLEE